MFRIALVVLGTIGLFALFAIGGVFQSNAFVAAGHSFSWAFTISGMFALVAWVKGGK